MSLFNVFVKQLSRNEGFLGFAKKLCASARVSDAHNYGLPELTPYSTSVSEISERRLNIVVPGISEQHVFGGIATALKLFDDIAKQYTDLRIIVSDEQAVVVPHGQFYSRWDFLPLDCEDKRGKVITVSGDRYGKSLPIRRNDIFVATAWWTALAIKQFMVMQRDAYGESPSKFVYIIQDFEPGFYAWSARYALAVSTYTCPESIVGVFNTALLRDYFQENGIQFNDEYTFEPRLNHALSEYRKGLDLDRKKRKLLVYGRPSVERNAFPLIVATLQQWSLTFAGASNWEVISLGELHPDIPLPGGGSICSLGKVSLEEYASHLIEAAVGLSLMISPHPSYPPLELAAFGAGVVTNSYENKDLSLVSDNIESVDVLTPENICAQISKLCQEFERDPGTFVENIPPDFYFLDEVDPFGFSSDLSSKLV